MKKFAMNGAAAAATGLILVAGVPAFAADHAWSPIQPTGGVTRDFVEIGDELWMYAIGGVHKSVDAGATWTVQPQVPEGGALSVSPHDSNLIYRGGSSQIHRSTDAGATWTTTDLPTTAVFGDVVVDIAFHQTDPMAAYAAVDNVGIYATDDGGATWSLLGTQPASLDFESLVSDPHNAGVMYLGVANEGIYKSSDSAASWTPMNAGLPLRYIDIITFDPAVPDTVFVGSGGDFFIYRSLDGGATWAALTNGLPPNGLTPSAIEPGDEPAEYYATFDGVSALGPGSRAFKSIDGGDTWTGLTPPVAARGPQTTAIYVDPATPDRLIIGTRIGNFESADDGTTWAWSNAGFNQAVITDFAFGGEAGEIYVSSRTAGLLKSADAGATWNHLNEGIEEGDFVAIAVSPHDAEHLIASNFSGPFVSEDGGASWLETDFPNMVMHALAFDPVDASTAYAVSDGGSTLMRSNDGGLTWTEFPTGIRSVHSDVPTKIVASALTPGLLYMNHHDGLYKSVDGGQTWALANGNLTAETAYTVALRPDDVVFASFGGTVNGAYRSADGGQTWEQVWMSTPLGGGSMRAIAFDPRDSQRMLAATAMSVLGSIDGGANWVALDAGLDTDLQQVNMIAFDPVVEGRYFLASGSFTSDAVLQVYTGGIAVDLIGSATRMPTSVEIGETIDVEFSVSNLAGYAATGTTFAMTVPDEFTLTSWAFADATCAQDGLTLECTLPTVAVDAVLAGTATLTAASAGSGSISIAVDAAEPDVDEANNAVSMSVTATEPATTPPPTGGGDGDGDTDSGGGGGSSGWLWLLAMSMVLAARVSNRRIIPLARH